MQVKDLRAMLDTCPDDMPVLIKHFGNEDKDEPDTFEDLAHTEIEKVDGADTFTIAGY